MGTKKAKKVLDSTAEEAPVQELEKKKKVKKAKSEIDDIFGKKEAPVQEEEKEKVKEKAKSEIDDIFGQKKRKKVEGEEEKKKEQHSEVVKLNSKGELVKPKKPKAAKSTPAAAAAAAGPTSRKKTEDGFTVYSAEELGFNKKNAGGTKLCPFDCDCCF